MVISNPVCSSDSALASIFLFLKRKKTPGHWIPQDKCYCQIKCIASGPLWWLFYATFRNLWTVCCGQGGLLSRKIKQISPFSCGSALIDRVPEPSCLTFSFIYIYIYDINNTHSIIPAIFYPNKQSYWTFKGFDFPVWWTGPQLKGICSEVRILAWCHRKMPTYINYLCSRSSMNWPARNRSHHILPFWIRPFIYSTNCKKSIIPSKFLQM